MYRPTGTWIKDPDEKIKLSKATKQIITEGALARVGHAATMIIAPHTHEQSLQRNIILMDRVSEQVYVHRSLKPMPIVPVFKERRLTIKKQTNKPSLLSVSLLPLRSISNNYNSSKQK